MLDAFEKHIDVHNKATGAQSGEVYANTDSTGTQSRVAHITFCLFNKAPGALSGHALYLETHMKHIDAHKKSTESYAGVAYNIFLLPPDHIPGIHHNIHTVMLAWCAYVAHKGT